MSNYQTLTSVQSSVDLRGQVNAVGGPSHGPGGAARWILVIVEWTDAGSGSMSAVIQESTLGTFTNDDLRNILIDSVSTAGVAGHHVYILDRNKMDHYWRVALSGTSYNPATVTVLEFGVNPSNLADSTNMTIVEI